MVDFALIIEQRKTDKSPKFTNALSQPLVLRRETTKGAVSSHSVECMSIISCSVAFNPAMPSLSRQVLLQWTITRECNPHDKSTSLLRTGGRGGRSLAATIMVISHRNRRGESVGHEWEIDAPVLLPKPRHRVMQAQAAWAYPITLSTPLHARISSSQAIVVALNDSFPP